MVLLGACNQQEKTKPVASSESLQLRIIESKPDSTSFVVLPFDKKSDYLFKGAKPAELSVTEISRVESLLKQAVHEHNKAQEKDYQEMLKSSPNTPYGRENYFIDLQKYRRQFIAMYNASGEKEVWVNCFCSGSESNWRREVVMVDDGGNCFFNLKINLFKGTWHDMMVNGLA